MHTPDHQATTDDAPDHIRAQLLAFGTIPPGLSDADRAQWIALRGEEILHCP